VSLWELESGQRIWGIKTNRFRDVICSPTDTNLALVLPHTWSDPMMGVLDVSGGHFTATSPTAGPTRFVSGLMAGNWPGGTATRPGKFQSKIFLPGACHQV